MEPLPDFERPPVAEVALAVQFEPLHGLRQVDLGRVYEAFAPEFPVVEEHPTRPPTSLEPVEVSLQLTNETLMPCLWFMTEERDRLVQFQRDRLVVNWRREEDQPYPRYEKAVRAMLESAWERLAATVETLGLDPLRPNVCEVAYVNPIEADERWSQHGELDLVIAPWSGQHSDDFLPEPIDVRVAARYGLPDGAGILTVDATPMTRTPDNTATMLQLAARGLARREDLAGAFAFLDLGREWIVRGFVSFTEADMHQAWGKETNDG